MITALSFVPKGAAKHTPVRDEPDEQELEQLRQAALETGALNENAMEDDDDDEEDDEDGWETDEEGEEVAAAAHAKAVAASMKEAPNPGRLEAAFKKLDMDNYDNEQDNLIAQVLEGSRIEHEGDDPYITLHEDDDDIEDDTVKASDLLILAAKTEEDSATLEVWLFEEPDEEGAMNAYVHHDIMLPAFPLSVAWMSFNPADPSTAGSFAAISTFEPEIEIWNLDVLDAMQPALVLGGIAGDDLSVKPTKKGSKKSKKKPAYKAGSHTDSVLALAWNAAYQNVLASGSADHTIKIWDLAAAKCEHTLTTHAGKVQALAWNPAEANFLLSGGFDARVCLSDMRAPGAPAVAWKVPRDVEALAWHPQQPTQFVVSTEDGHVRCFDTRGGACSEPVFTLAAHDKPTTSLAFNPVVPNLLVTGSVDKTIKLWELSDNSPKLLATEDLDVGAVFAVGVPADAAHLIAAGGAKGVVSVFDMLYKPALKKRFRKHFVKAAA